METGLFTLLVFLGIFRFLREWESGGAPLSAVLFLLAGLTRPEGAFIAAVCGVYYLAANLKSPESGWFRRLLIWGAVFALPFAVYWIWRWQYFGYFFPNTFYLKVDFSPEMWVRGGLYIVKFFLVHSLLVLIVVFGALFGFLPRNRASGFFLVMITLYGAYNICLGGDYMSYFRFLHLVLPLLFFLGGESIAGLSGLWGRRGLRVAAAGISIALISIQTASYTFPLEKRLFKAGLFKLGHVYLSTGYSSSKRNELLVKTMQSVGLYFRRNVPREKVVAAEGIGAFGYYYGGNILDLGGILSPEHAQRDEFNYKMGFPGHYKYNHELLLEEGPDYYLFQRFLFPKPLSNEEIERLVQRWRRIRNMVGEQWESFTRCYHLEYVYIDNIDYQGERASNRRFPLEAAYKAADNRYRGYYYYLVKSDLSNGLYVVRSNAFAFP